MRLHRLLAVLVPIAVVASAATSVVCAAAGDAKTRPQANADVVTSKKRFKLM